MIATTKRTNTNTVCSKMCDRCDQDDRKYYVGYISTAIYVCCDRSATIQGKNQKSHNNQKQIKIKFKAKTKSIRDAI